VKAYLQRMQTAQDVIFPCLWIASVLICLWLVITPMFGSRGNATLAVNTIQDLKEGLLVQVLI
jgi:hypothetical protein